MHHAAGVIREVLSCRPGQLSDVAKAKSVPPAVAQELRLHWMRVLSGKCPACGRVTKGSTCTHCVTGNKLSLRPKDLLLELESEDVVIRGKCLSCTCEITQTAGEVLQRLEQDGYLKPIHFCGRCQNVKHRKRRQNKAKK